MQDLDFATLRAGCPFCAVPGAGATVIGKARVELRSSRPSAGSNRIAVAVDYAPGSRFERNAELALLSAPRDVRAAASTREGPVRGTMVESLDRFFDIPLAAPPVGSLRFRAPQAPPLRDVVHDGRAVGPGCIQAGGSSPFGSAPGARARTACSSTSGDRPGRGRSR